MIERYWVWVFRDVIVYAPFPFSQTEPSLGRFASLIFSNSFVKLSPILWSNPTVIYCAKTGRIYWRIWRRKESLRGFTREVFLAKKIRTRWTPNLLRMSKENVCLTFFPKEDQKLFVPFATSYTNCLLTWNHFWGRFKKRVRYFVCCHCQLKISMLIKFDRSSSSTNSFNVQFWTLYSKRA